MIFTAKTPECFYQFIDFISFNFFFLMESNEGRSTSKVLGSMTGESYENWIIRSLLIAISQIAFQLQMQATK